ncbi:MAG: hypothetical protein JWQ24_5672 [Tardiphaga sp.]|nr:hypothetical protein [Tardiphaga sp.]
MKAHLRVVSTGKVDSGCHRLRGVTADGGREVLGFDVGDAEKGGFGIRRAVRRPSWLVLEDAATAAERDLP